MYRGEMQKMLANKKAKTISMATGRPVAEGKIKKRIKVRKLRANGVSRFLNTMGVASVFVGKDGIKYKCRYGENADGSCINGELQTV